MKTDEGNSSESEDSNAGVTIPEEFQQATHKLVQSASNKHQLHHISDKVSARQSEMQEEEMAKDSKKGSPKVKSFNSEMMPSE
jgi:hypothetical protein